MRDGGGEGEERNALWLSCVSPLLLLLRLIGPLRLVVDVGGKKKRTKKKKKETGRMAGAADRRTTAAKRGRRTARLVLAKREVGRWEERSVGGGGGGGGSSESGAAAVAAAAGCHVLGEEAVIAGFDCYCDCSLFTLHQPMKPPHPPPAAPGWRGALARAAPLGKRRGMRR